MLESEARGGHLALVIKDDVERVLLSTDTVALTTIRLNLYFDEERHLLVKAKDGGRCTAAILVPHVARIDKVPEGAHPAVDWRKNGVIQSSHLGCNQVHRVQVCLVRVVYVLEDDVGWGARLAVKVQRFEVVVRV